MAAVEVTRARAAVAIVDRVDFTLADEVDLTAKIHLVVQRYLFRNLYSSCVLNNKRRY